MTLFYNYFVKLYILQKMFKYFNYQNVAIKYERITFNRNSFGTIFEGALNNKYSLGGNGNLR